MSLSAPEQRALKSIERGLSGAAPELVARLATFSRLAVGEEMPAWESLRAGAWDAPTHRLGRQWSLVLVWLTVAIGLIVFALVLNHNGSRGVFASFGPVAVSNYYIVPRYIF